MRQKRTFPFAGKSNSLGAKRKSAEASAMSLTRKAPTATKKDDQPGRQELVQALAEREAELAEARRQNSRLFDEMQAKTRDLEEFLQQQTAPAGVLKVISRSAFIRRGRYPDFKGPLPFTPGYDLVGVVETTGPAVTAPPEGQLVADLCFVGGYAQYAIRPARFLVPVPDGVDPAEAVCIPLAYLTAFQMLTRYRRLPRGAAILVIGTSGTVGMALLDLARHSGLEAIGTCSAANAPAVEHFGAVAIDYRAGDFVAAVRRITSGRKGGAGVDAAFDAIGGAHFSRSFASLAKGGLLVGYGSQAMAVGREGLLAAGPGLARLKAWNGLRRMPNGAAIRRLELLIGRCVLTWRRPSGRERLQRPPSRS
jgi:NADPH:quinone reductase-like Zn-dependent oxidoreductase